MRGGLRSNTGPSKSMSEDEYNARSLDAVLSRMDTKLGNIEEGQSVILRKIRDQDNEIVANKVSIGRVKAVGSALAAVGSGILGWLSTRQ